MDCVLSDRPAVSAGAQDASSERSIGSRTCVKVKAYTVAGPLRFRVSWESWSVDRVKRDLLRPLDSTVGATIGQPNREVPGEFSGKRFEMANGDIALFAWRTNDDAPHVGYWLGNTSTPKVLWRTDKIGFEAAPGAIGRWAQRELLSDLREQDPWLAEFGHLSWFFLPVFHSKDGRESTRTFFREHAAGFPDAESEQALRFYEEFLHTGALDSYRETMAGKLGTSSVVDRVRMSSAMSEITAAKLLFESGYEFVPEIELDSGYALDFRVGETLVEVTRPRPPTRRSVDSPIGALKQTAGTKTDGQLDAHPDALLLVDCSSFRDEEWNAIRGEHPSVPHTPSIVFRARPNGSVEGYTIGEPPLELGGAISWLT